MLVNLDPMILVAVLEYIGLPVLVAFLLLKFNEDIFSVVPAVPVHIEQSIGALLPLKI